MKLKMFVITVKHTLVKLPYPFKAYENLTDNQQFEWRLKM
jgi:hypothetical protein